MNSMIRRSVKVPLMLSAGTALIALAGCTTVTTTQIDTVAIGSPVWMKRTIRTDEKTMFGAKTVDMEVGFLYCEKNDSDGPVCLPVDVKAIPRTMTHQAFDVENGINLPLKAHRGETAMDRRGGSRSNNAAPTYGKSAGVIYNMTAGGDAQGLQAALSSYINQPIVVTTNKGNTYKGLLTRVEVTNAPDGSKVFLKDGDKAFFLRVDLINSVARGN